MLWLPKNVEIYFDFGKHHYYRHYTFDNYMLFDVDASEKVKLPPDTAPQNPPRQHKGARIRGCSVLRTTAYNSFHWGQLLKPGHYTQNAWAVRGQ